MRCTSLVGGGRHSLTVDLCERSETKLVSVQKPYKQKPKIELAKQNQEQCSRRSILKGPVLASLAFTCSCCSSALAGANQWGYGTEDGPAAWTEICQSGLKQSPINLPVPGKLPVYTGRRLQRIQSAVIQRHYSDAATVRVIDTGHGNLQVNVEDGGFCSIQGQDLKLLQWHFHTPSEHAFANVREAMELHVVHRNVVSGELLVLGILLRNGGNLPLKALQIALAHAPSTANPPESQAKGLDISKVLGQVLEPTSAGIYQHYVGSLTTPPCTEGVQWYVAAMPAFVTDRQVADFQAAIAARKPYKFNARPLQSIKAGCIDIQQI